MELTPDQALQKAIEAHKAGQVQEANRLYTAILKALPKHPDANHNMGVLAVGVGKVQEALPFFRTALEANPTMAQFWFSYIDALITLEKMDEAKAMLERAKVKGAKGDEFDKLQKRVEGIEPTAKIISYTQEPPQEKVNYFVGLYKKGQLQRALDEATALLPRFPNSIAIHDVCGASYLAQGKLKESIQFYRKVMAIRPDHSACNNLGFALKDYGKLDEAIECFNKAIAAKPDFAVAYNNLGNAFRAQGNLEKAIESYNKSLSLNPNDTLALMNLSNVRSVSVPRWHFPMMNDTHRNKAYLDALKLAISKNDFVLEIGTGSGLLAMMAASCGSNQILSCEVSKTIFEAAEQIISHNGYDDKVKVINKKSTELVVGLDLPKKADVIISEVLSAELVGEGVQHTLLDANNRLISKHGKMLPESGDIRVALLGDNPEINQQTSVGAVCGFDLSKFNSIAASKFSINLKNKPELLSDKLIAFKINFSNASSIVKGEKILNFTVLETGLCFGLIQWVGIQIFRNIEYENKPGEVTSHWPTPVYLFDSPLEVTMGQILKVRATLFTDSIWFDLID